MQPIFRAVIFRGYYYAVWKERRVIRRISLRTKDREAALQALRNFANQYAMANRPKVITVEFVWNEYRNTLKGRPSYHNMGFEARSILASFALCPADQIRNQDCLVYIAARRALGKKDGTIWTELGRLRSALRWAEKTNLITKAPFIFRPAMSPPRDLRLTRQQAYQFLSSCITPHIRLFVILAMTTGARSGALLSLTWNQVNLEKRFIDLNSPKRGDQSDSICHRKNRAVVPINQTLLMALQDAKQAATTPQVVEWNGRPVKSVKKGLAAAGRRSGLPWVTAHVFRHSAASWMAEAGINMDRIAAFLGHSDSRITSRVYAKFSPDYLRDAAGALEINTSEKG